jgi:Protein of unknown function (DUF2752)
VVHCANPQKRTNAQVEEEAAVDSGRQAGPVPEQLRLAMRRPRSVPEQLGLAGLGAAAASLVYPAASHATGINLPCPLRTFTGVPCPLCGMTTAATSLAAGDPRAALAANPFVLLLAGLTAAMVVLVAARGLGLAAPPAIWPAGRQRHARRVVTVLFVASWTFQLYRFHWI